MRCGRPGRPGGRTRHCWQLSSPSATAGRVPRARHSVRPPGTRPGQTRRIQSAVRRCALRRGGSVQGPVRGGKTRRARWSTRSPPLPKHCLRATVSWGRRRGECRRPVLERLPARFERARLFQEQRRPSWGRWHKLGVDSRAYLRSDIFQAVPTFRES